MVHTFLNFFIGTNNLVRHPPHSSQQSPTVHLKRVFFMGIQDDRRNYVMSLELAMQREMNYREKLQKQGPLKCPMPQVPRLTHGPESSCSVPVTRPPLYPNPSQHSRPPPYPHTSPRSRASPSSGPSNSTHHWRTGPAPLPEGIFTCKVCQIDCKTGFNLLTHYQGNKHRSKVRGIKGKEVAGGSTPRENEKRPYCDLCGIWCTDEYTFRLHFNCTNHILRHYDYLVKARVYS